MTDLAQDDRANLRDIATNMESIANLLIQFNASSTANVLREDADMVRAIAGPPPLEPGWYWTDCAGVQRKPRYFNGEGWCQEQNASPYIDQDSITAAGPRIEEPSE